MAEDFALLRKDTKAMREIGAKPRGRCGKTVSQTKFLRVKKDLTREIDRLDAEIRHLQQCVKDPYTTQSVSRNELIHRTAERLRDLLERPIRSKAIKRLSAAETRKKMKSALEQLDPYTRSQLPEANFLLRIVGDRDYPNQRPIDFIATSCAGAAWNLSPRRSRDICAQERKHKPWTRCKRCSYSGFQDEHATFHAEKLRMRRYTKMRKKSEKG